MTAHSFPAYRTPVKSESSVGQHPEYHYHVLSRIIPGYGTFNHRLLIWSENVWIWNRSRVRFNYKLWRVNLNFTIINGMMIKYLHYSWNHKTVFGRRGAIFEVIWCRLAVPLSWWISWSVATKGVEFIHLYYKTWWEEFRAKDDSGISLVSNPSTEF